MKDEKHRHQKELQTTRVSHSGEKSHIRLLPWAKIAIAPTPPKYYLTGFSNVFYILNRFTARVRWLEHHTLSFQTLGNQWLFLSCTQRQSKWERMKNTYNIPHCTWSNGFSVHHRRVLYGTWRCTRVAQMICGLFSVLSKHVSSFCPM